MCRQITVEQYELSMCYKRHDALTYIMPTGKKVIMSIFELARMKKKIKILENEIINQSITII